MQSSNAPSKIQLPFASSGTKNTIPVPSQQGVTPGAASFTDGFPPLTFTPLSAGGVPPSGADFNGVLNAITALQQWKSAGGQFPFDATFATAIGGYPKGATVLKADGTGLWISTAENNTANPDTGGAGWLAFSASSIQAGSYNSASDTGTANAYAMSLAPAPASLTPGMMVTLSNVAATNTGASTLNVNGLGALPIYKADGIALTGYELAAGASARFALNAAANAWVLAGSSGWYSSPHGRAVFTSTSSFIIPDGITAVWVSGCGGGCGGFPALITSTKSGGAGGECGQFIFNQKITIYPGANILITIGSGGVNGSPGGTTSIINGANTVISLAGGAAPYSPGIDGGINNYGGWSGPGQDGPFGAGGGTNGSNSSNGATGYGAGGGGGGAVNASSPTPGGAGASGIIILEW